MKERVLVADDDPSVRKSLRKVLVDAGYEVVLAADSQEAVEQFANGRIDLMLLDIGLPARTGWSAFERITNQVPVLPIIVVTGGADQHDLAVAAGVGALMEKPLDVTALLDKIQKLLVEPLETRLLRLCGEAPRAHHAPSAQHRV